MYYLIYKTTHKNSGKYYIGCHKTANLNDNYLGSGKYLLNAIKKYGKENFTKEILHICSSADEMYKKEAEIVNEDFIATENTYNIRIGGNGGFDYIRNHPKYKEWRQKAIQKAAKKISETTKGRPGHFTKGFTGKTHTEKAKLAISNARKGRYTGASNANAKSVQDNEGNVFDTLNECALFHKVHVGTISNRIKKGIYKIIC